MAKRNNGGLSAAQQERFPVQALREHISYDPEAGTFTRIAPDGSRPVGVSVGRVQPSSGYCVVYALGAYHLGQRVAWALMTGSWPSGLIDFVNGDRSDCRWENLRTAASDMSRLDRDGLMAALDYDPDSGVFRWRYRFDKPTKWNTRWADKPAGGYDKDGYQVITVNGHGYKAHRLAVLFVTGEWPPEDVDHADLNPGNNRFSNLRVATRSENNGNRTMQGRAASGLKGAYRVPSTGRWYSRIARGDYSECLGTFDTKEQAHQAYVAAAERVFGEFARGGL